MSLHFLKNKMDTSKEVCKFCTENTKSKMEKHRCSSTNHIHNQIEEKFDSEDSAHAYTKKLERENNSYSTSRVEVTKFESACKCKCHKRF